MKGYKEIERRLDSLKNRTNLTVSLKGETWEFKGLNSPYISHQTCTLKEGHGVPNLVDFCEGFLFVAPRFSGEIHGQFIVRELPAFYFAGLFRFPAAMPEWISDPMGRVRVFYPDLFMGFDDDGNPDFSGDPDVYLEINGVQYDLVVSKAAAFVRDKRTTEHKIGCQRVYLRDPQYSSEGVFAYAFGRLIAVNEAIPELTKALLDRHQEVIDNILGTLGLTTRCAGNCEASDSCTGCPFNGQYQVEYLEGGEIF